MLADAQAAHGDFDGEAVAIVGYSSDHLSLPFVQIGNKRRATSTACAAKVARSSQYSSGSKIVVELRSASVMTQSLAPLLVL